MSTTLQYASPTTPSVRFRPLALAAILILAGTILTFIPQLLSFIPTLEIRNTVSQVLFVFHWTAVLAAVFLFNAALPSLAPTPRFRTPFLACAAIAAAALLIRLFYLVLYVAYPAYPRSGSAPLGIFLNFTYCLTTILQLALLAAAAFFFYLTARRLDRTPLGILAAAAFAPNFLLGTIFLVFNVYRLVLLTASIPTNILIVFSYSSSLNLLLQFLLWLTLALFTAILALQQPRHPLS